ncbi:unnamed protein product [Trichobilharzia szidati]|nr:unnamed protein product [Trichobilharzia szidati]
MRIYIHLVTIQLYVAYHIFCIASVRVQAKSRCIATINNDGSPPFICDNEKLIVEPQQLLYDDEQNEVIFEMANENDLFQQRSSAPFLDNNRAFVQLGKKGFVRIGKRGFVRIGR